MKINIWIKKEEVLSGKITEYHCNIPNIRHEEFINISISQDEFAKLEDEKHDRWLVSQYNRNRDHDEQIADVNQISESGRSHVNYIYERNTDTGQTTRRVSGDYDNNEKI
jgi:hypothetical protein